MARPLRRQFEGALYHLVVRATARERLFRDDQDRRYYLQLLLRYRNQFGVRFYAYGLMSRRVQLVLETPKGNVSKLMQCLGTSYASYFNRRHKRRGSLYEGRYRSYLLPDTLRLLEATRYIHRVSPGSGLKRKRQYRWSSYRAYLGAELSDLVETEPVLRHFGDSPAARRKRYRDFAEGPRAVASYRATVRSETTEPRARPDGTGGRTSSPDSLRKAHQILRDVRVSLGNASPPDPGKRRKRALVHHVAMYLIRKQTQLSLNVIGRLLGVKAPAVAVAIGKLEKSLTVGELSFAVRSLLQADSVSDREGRER